MPITNNGGINPLPDKFLPGPKYPYLYPHQQDPTPPGFSGSTGLQYGPQNNQFPPVPIGAGYPGGVTSAVNQEPNIGKVFRVNPGAPSQDKMQNGTSIQQYLDSNGMGLGIPGAGNLDGGLGTYGGGTGFEGSSVLNEKGVGVGAFDPLKGMGPGDFKTDSGGNWFSNIGNWFGKHGANLAAGGQLGLNIYQTALAKKQLKQNEDYRNWQKNEFRDEKQYQRGRISEYEQRSKQARSAFYNK